MNLDSSIYESIIKKKAKKSTIVDAKHVEFMGVKGRSFVPNLNLLWTLRRKSFLVKSESIFVD